MKQERISSYPRGERTRANILTAARDRFAAEGYERATIRSIAQDAGIDPSLVIRYYGNKAGLFAAAVDFDLQLPDLKAVPKAEAGSVIVSRYFDRWENDERFSALLRAAATNAEAAERMRKISSQQTLPFVTQLCGNPESAPIRNNLVNSQLWGFAYCRYILKLPHILTMTRTEIVKWLGPTVQRYIFDK